MDCPNHEIHEIKCPTKINYFTATVLENQQIIDMSWSIDQPKTYNIEILFNYSIIQILK